MTSTIKALESRRQQLQLQAARERAAFIVHFEPLDRPFRWFDQGIGVIQFIKDTPILWTSAFALLAHYKPKMASKALVVGSGVIKLLKSVKSAG